MKKLILNFLSIFVLLLITVTCKKDDPEPDPNKIIIAENLKSM